MKIEELEKPLDRKYVKERKQGGTNVSYIEAWHAINEANRIFGFDGWVRETVYNKEICRDERKVGKAQNDGYKVGYEACVQVRVFDGDKIIIREGTGHGSGISVDLFDCIEGAAKEAETDAMKRALMTFGNQFGLALYDKTQSNVEDVPEPVKVITLEQVQVIAKLLEETNTDKADFIAYVNKTNNQNFKAISGFPVSFYEWVINALNRKKESK